MSDIINLDGTKAILTPEKVFYIMVGRIGHYNLYLKVMDGTHGRVNLGATSNIAEAKQFTNKKDTEDFIKLSPTFTKCTIIEYDYINFTG